VSGIRCRHAAEQPLTNLASSVARASEIDGHGAQPRLRVVEPLEGTPAADRSRERLGHDVLGLRQVAADAVQLAHEAAVRRVEAALDRILRLPAHGTPSGVSHPYDP
jgi:hypothetical protein